MTSPKPTPDSIFVSWLAKQRAGEAEDLDALCAKHPEHADALRDLYAQWKRVEALQRQAGLGGSLSERLNSQYGSRIDPKVTLEGEEQRQSDSSSVVLQRLAGRGPASTRYRLKGEVASGGMGAILRVWDEDLRRHLAMKVMLGTGSPEGAGETPQVNAKLLARFLEEAQVTGQLDHPNIVPVHELGLDPDGQVYFTMKLVKGKTLREVFDLVRDGEEGWTQVRALSLLLKVCEAMAYAHDKGVIHRDLKPANVMVGRYGEVYVMDWGLAKVLGQNDERDLRVRPEAATNRTLVRSDRGEHAGTSDDSPLVTMDGDIVGTPAYMSPEQARGDLDSMGPQSDVYALGAMLYHLAVGHVPYQTAGAKVSPYMLLRWVQEGAPKPVHELAPDTPAELVAICEKAMERDVEARYPNTAALAEDLSAYVEGRVVGAYETGAWAEARKWVKRNKSLAGALAAAAVLLVVGLISSLYLKSQSDANAEDARLNEQRADAKSAEAQANLVLAQENELQAQASLVLAQQKEAEAQAEREQARKERDRAEAETAKVLRLSDVKRLQELVADADASWPAYPEKIADLESWLDRARDLLAGLPGHRATLAEMRSGALPWTNEQRARVRESHPRAAELREKQSEFDGLLAQLDGGLAGEQIAIAEERLAALEPEVQDLTDEVESRRTWRFEAPQIQWQHDVLVELVEGLEALEAEQLSEKSIGREYGWSVGKRLDFARELERGFANGGEYAAAWTEALWQMDETYPGLDLKPQMGLVPIGPDPESGLWEFAHLMTGVPPGRDVEGRLVLTEEMAVVLVLIPAGSFWMGAQKGDPNGRNHDPLAHEDEGPVHEVELSAYMLSKFELTQGQWKRLTGRNPSTYGPHNWNSFWFASGKSASLLQPVEQVSWLDCMVWLPRAGLSLPSEAQWECGARAGTQTVYWSGSDLASLEGVANLSDSYGKSNGSESWPIWEPDFDDGATVHWPVGTSRANAFGLHDVHGNLWEWCQDGYNDTDSYERSQRNNPVGPWDGADFRVYRGGSFNAPASFARSANRTHRAPSRPDYYLGVRPAWVINE